MSDKNVNCFSLGVGGFDCKKFSSDIDDMFSLEHSILICFSLLDNFFWTMATIIISGQMVDQFGVQDNRQLKKTERVQLAHTRIICSVHHSHIVLLLQNML